MPMRCNYHDYDYYFFHFTFQLNIHTLEVVYRYATHNFKWVKMTHTCLILDLFFANPDV